MKNKLLFFVVVLLLISPVVIAAPRFQSADISEALATVGKMLQKVIANDYALYFIMAVLIYLLVHKLLQSVLSKVPILGGNIESGPIKTISIALAILISLSFLYFLSRGGVANFVKTVLGGTATLTFALAAVMVFQIVKSHTQGYAMPVISTAILLLLFAYLTKRRALGYLAVTILVIFFIIHFGFSNSRGSPYARNPGSPRAQQRWYHRFGNTMRNLGNTLSNARRRIMGNKDGFIRIGKREESEKQYEEYLAKLRNLSDEQITRLTDYINRPGQKDPNYVKDAITKLIDLNHKLENADDVLINEEKLDIAEETKIKNDEHNEEKELDSEVSDINSDGIKDQALPELKSADKDEIRTEKSLESIVDDDINRKEKEEIILEKDRKLLNKSENILNQVLERFGSLQSSDIEVRKKAQKQISNLLNGFNKNHNDLKQLERKFNPEEASSISAIHLAEKYEDKHREEVEKLMERVKVLNQHVKDKEEPKL